MAQITSVRLPIDWTQFGWAPAPTLGSITLATGDPAWGWSQAAPAFAVHTFDVVASDSVEEFNVDHIVLLVPDLGAAVATLGRVGLEPRLKMKVSGRPAAFFRAGTVLEVIESPVRDAAVYGLALTTSTSLEAVSLSWKSLGLELGTIKPAIQPGRRIMTVHGLDAGLAVMSEDGSVASHG